MHLNHYICAALCGRIKARHRLFVNKDYKLSLSETSDCFGRKRQTGTRFVSHKGSGICGDISSIRIRGSRRQSALGAVITQFLHKDAEGEQQCDRVGKYNGKCVEMQSIDNP